MRNLLLIIAGLVLSASALGQIIDINDVIIKDGVKWIDETPVNPEEYIGRIFVVRSGIVTPHYQALALPFEVTETPTIKKSMLITAKSDASVSFADIVNIKATSDSVYEFQNVNTRTWSAKSKEPAYLDAIIKFRNGITSAPIFTDKTVEAVLMCVGIVEKKVWYRSYKKQGIFGAGTYFVKVGGSTYSGSEEYEEVIKFGLLVRPISGYGIYLPPTIANAAELKSVVHNPQAITQTNDVLKNMSGALKF